MSDKGDRREEMYRRVSVQVRSLQPLDYKDDGSELVEHITRGVKVISRPR